VVDEFSYNAPERLDRLIEVMHHFHCREPGELEELLELPEGSLARMFRENGTELAPEVESAMVRAGVREQFLRDGCGSMLAHLLRVIATARLKLEQAGARPGLPRHVTDGSQRPTALEEELINLLIEALSDPSARERLLKFIRKEAENRYRPGPRVLL
jgi:hypothetical protein